MIQTIDFPIHELQAYSTTMLHLSRSFGFLYHFIYHARNPTKFVVH